jgi:two-component system OmpR family sensor kinase
VSSLRVRLPLLAFAILAVSLSVATLLAYQLMLSTGYDDLDEALREERDRIRDYIASDDFRAAGPRGPRDPTLWQVVHAYFEFYPSPPAYLTTASFRGRTILEEDSGPPGLREIAGDLEVPRSNELITVSVPDIGDVRTLSVDIESRSWPVATFQVMGPLEPIRARAVGASLRLGMAALVSLLIGGALLSVVLRRALVPLRDLATTARSIDYGDLGFRVQEPQRADEVGTLAREFNLMLERLESTARSRREFLAQISHELRTPVTIARGHMEALEAVGTRDPAAVSETAAVVADELQLIARLVEDLMALARSEIEDFVVPEAMTLPRFFEELGFRLTGLGVHGVVLQDPPGVTIQADADRLAQAILNLVVNADLHTPEETRIEVGAEMSSDSVAIFVRDEGSGIDPAIRDRVFESFVSDPNAPRGGSTGLGLAVVAAVAKAHGGSVEVDTGHSGTTVTLRIPIAAESVAEEEKVLS